MDTFDNLYVTSTDFQVAQLWANGSTRSSRNFSTGPNAPSAVFVDTNGHVYVDNGENSNRRVDKYAPNSTTPTPAMFVDGRCIFLFIDASDNLYCSMADFHRVIRNSLNGNINQTTVVAGTGTSGSVAQMLNGPRGIFVTSTLTLYVADAFNDRIQMYQPGQRNGTTIIGNGSAVSLLLSRPVGIILDGSGYLFIADAWSHRIIGSGPFGFRCLLGCGSGSNQLALSLIHISEPTRRS